MALEQPTDDSPPSPPPSTRKTTPLGSSVIPIVNKLQDIFAQLGTHSSIELPQVAVVGSQSSGKSSVLEALVGRDFLPRGNDICTRRPLVLQLVQTKSKSSGGSDDEWGEFLHLPSNHRIYDFSEIRREIEAETNRLAGENKGVKDKQIRLKIFSPNVLDITLVDLPGITKVPVGDQPTDIEARIRTMILSYIKQPSCLILAVTPANSDLANSDALQIAGNADPDGHRTIGVITKLDIMDKGTDARNLLLGKVVPLRLGYVGVVNRCQEDILLNRSVKEALSAEEKFFRSRPAYHGLADRVGIPQLAKKLNQILVQHIKALLPDLKSRISNALVATAKEHQSYGEITESRAGQGALLLNFLSKYCEAYSSLLEGKSEEMSTSELSGGARIHYIFQSIFVKSLEEVDPCEDLTDDDIRTAIQNATGPRSALFVPDVPFEVLVRRQISRLLDPSLQCARFIFDELIKISHKCMMNEIQRFPVLRKRMDEVIGDFLREGLEPSEAMIGDIIDMEMDYINTSHPNFIGGTKAVEAAMQKVKSSRIPHPVARPKDTVEPDRTSSSSASQVKSRSFLGRQANGIVVDQGVVSSDSEKAAPAANASESRWGIPSIFRGSDNRGATKENLLNKPFSEAVEDTSQSNLSMIYLKGPPAVLRPSETHTEQEDVEIEITKLLLRSYYDIVRKNIEDFVPKAIMHFLVNHTKRELHKVFIRKLYRENLFEEMLQEPDEIAGKRKRTQETLHILQQAYRTLDELPLEAESVSNGGTDTTGVSKYLDLPTSSSMYSTSSSSYSASPGTGRRSRRAQHQNGYGF
ncbi:dynamin-related protein 3A-like isoform X2 [Raphanus sativus]|uniref:Dynamin-related protein 3A-like isoform X2 n=1 Tax=Raphanus sativus TaxID=3726 RepID=A0A6J0NG34_RAPSA|nr:dynamin-related protein 3A-like isoform X2 [Raphanus sativus]XP_018483718.1 PREDICTED: dynamin-related protein 3A-like [Raphanus sativus]